MSGIKINDINQISSLDISDSDSVITLDNESQQTKRTTLKQISDFFVNSNYVLSPSSISSFAVTTVTAGNGLINGGGPGAVVLNVGAGDGISVTATQVSVNSTVVRTTGTNSVTLNQLNATVVSASSYLGRPSSGADILNNDNTFIGTNLFQSSLNQFTGSFKGNIQGSASYAGNAGSVTNGVYTNTIGSYATTQVIAGDGLSGGGTVGSLSLAVDSTVVRTTGNQTISGIKTFSSTITGSITGNAGSVTNGVYTTGNQTIDGTKTFSSIITGSITGNAGSVTNGVYTNTISSLAVTSLTAGTGLIGNATVGSVTLNLDFSELTDMTGDITGTTEFILQNGTTESRKEASEIKLSAFNNDSGWTSNIGDITEVIAGDGLTGGATSGIATLSVNNTVVRTTGNQTIGGSKTFTSIITGSINGSAQSSFSSQIANVATQITVNGSPPPDLYWVTFVDGTNGDRYPRTGQMIYNTETNVLITTASHALIADSVANAVYTVGNQLIYGNKDFFNTITGSITGSLAEFTAISASLAEIKDSIASDSNLLNVGVDRSLLPSDLDTYWHDYAKINFASVNEQNRTTTLSVLNQTDTDIYGTLAVASYTTGSTTISTSNTGIWSDARHYGPSSLRRLRGFTSFPFVDGTAFVSASFSYYGYTELDGGGTIYRNYGINIDGPTVNSGNIVKNYAIYVDDQDSAGASENYAIYVEADNNGYYTPFAVLKNGHVNIGADDVEDYKLFVREWNDTTESTYALIDSLCIDDNNGSTKFFQQNIRSRSRKNGTGTTDHINNFFGVVRANAGSGGTVNTYYGIGSRIDDEVGANVTFIDANMLVAERPILEGNSTIQYLHGLRIERMFEGTVANYMIYGETTNPDYNFQVTGDGHVGIGGWPGSYALYVSGSQASTTSTTFTILSDERTKTNIEQYSRGLKEIKQLNPVSFTYNGLGKTSEGYSTVGLIAQQVEEIIPEMVKKNEDFLSPEDFEKTELLSLDNHPLLFVMINAIKELNTKVEELQQEIQTLKNGQ